MTAIFVTAISITCTMYVIAPAAPCSQCISACRSAVQLTCAAGGQRAAAHFLAPLNAAHTRRVRVQCGGARATPPKQNGAPPAASQHAPRACSWGGAVTCTRGGSAQVHTFWRASTLHTHGECVYSAVAHAHTAHSKKRACGSGGGGCVGDVCSTAFARESRRGGARISTVVPRGQSADGTCV